MVTMSFERARIMLERAGCEVTGTTLRDGDHSYNFSANVKPDETNGVATLDGDFSAELLIAIGVWMLYPESVVNA